MRKRTFWLFGFILLAVLSGLGLILMRPLTAAASPPAAPDAHPAYLTQAAPRLQGSGACDVAAVDLIGAWVDAGAPETDAFPFIADNGTGCRGEFNTDVLPLFTEEGIWFEGSQACTECHFDNSEDSRHEMDLSSHAGILLGGDVLSDPPGVAIVIPGDWEASKLRGRLRDNRMPPGWEFDIEETNRDGPLVTVDGVDVTAVDLIGAWVDAGAPDGAFSWSDADGGEHEADFTADVMPFFTEEDIWFEGSQACTECHFDNSEDSRHEMDLSSHNGIMLGGDVLSDPPGVAIVLPGDWEASKLRARLRNNRMPPGWEFDIEETNRDGPLVMAGAVGEANAIVPVVAAVSSDPAPRDSAPNLPPPTITETVEQAVLEPMALALLGGITLVLGVVMLVVMINRLRDKERTPTRIGLTADVSLLLFTLMATSTGGLSLHGVITKAFTETRTVHEEVPYPVEVSPHIPIVAEVRLEDWQARIPEAYADLANPFSVTDEAAVAAGKQLYERHDCYYCHGITLDGQGTFSPGLTPKPVNLTDPTLMNLPFMTDNYLFWRISEGGGQSPFFSAMPAWGGFLSETERWQLVTYVRSKTADAEVDEGQQAAIAIIEQSGCFACHRSEAIGRGGKIGPGWDELAEVAATRVDGMSAEEYVRQSIVDPVAFIVPGYEDQAALMPPDFADRLSEEEVGLLVEFLLGLDDDS